MGLEVSAEALFLYRKPAENCRRSGGPGHRQQYSWTGYRCTGRGFSNSATDHRRRGHNPRQALYPITRERHRNGQRGRQKTGAALHVRGYPRGTGSAAQPIDRRCKATGRQCERYGPLYGCIPAHPCDRWGNTDGAHIRARVCPHVKQTQRKNFLMAHIRARGTPLIWNQNGVACRPAGQVKFYIFPALLYLKLQEL